MITNGHPLTRMAVALCAMVATLSACGATDDGGTTVTAEEVAQQEAQKKSQQDAQQEKPQKAAQEQKKDEAPARSTATDAELDAYVDAAEKALRQMFGDSFKKIYSELNIVPVYPNGIEYDYTFRAAVDPAVALVQLDTQAPTLRTQTRTVVVPEMERLGFADPTVTYTYRNPDGSVVWTRTFS
ncbi:hypothetical protein AAII07_44040 [Microvirga sp. 0TCS3.31]